MQQIKIAPKGHRFYIADKKHTQTINYKYMNIPFYPYLPLPPPAFMYGFALHMPPSLNKLSASGMHCLMTYLLHKAFQFLSIILIVLGIL